MSTYVFDNLVESEEIRYFTTVSYWAYLNYAIGSMLLALLAWGLHTYWYMPFFVPVLLLCASCANVMLLGVLRDSNELAVTNERVIIKTGWLNVRSAVIYLSRVEGVEVNQSFIGRILGYGTLLVRGVGTELHPVHYVLNPNGFRRAVFLAASECRPRELAQQSGEIAPLAA